MPQRRSSSESNIDGVYEALLTTQQASGAADPIFTIDFPGRAPQPLESGIAYPVDLTPPLRLPALLAEMRRERGLPQSDVANKAGWSQAMVSAVETSAFVPTPQIVGDIYRALGGRLLCLAGMTAGANQNTGTNKIYLVPVGRESSFAEPVGNLLHDALRRAKPAPGQIVMLESMVQSVRSAKDGANARALHLERLQHCFSAVGMQLFYCGIPASQ